MESVLDQAKSLWHVFELFLFRGGLLALAHLSHLLGQMFNSLLLKEFVVGRPVTKFSLELILLGPCLLLDALDLALLSLAPNLVKVAQHVVHQVGC